MTNHQLWQVVLRVNVTVVGAVGSARISGVGQGQQRHARGIAAMTADAWRGKKEKVPCDADMSGNWDLVRHPGRRCDENIS